MLESIRGSLWKVRVNTLLGSLFLGSFALAASLVIWQAASGENPIANAFAAHMAAQVAGQ